MEQKDLHTHLRTNWAKLWEQIRTAPYNRLAHKQEEILAKMALLEAVSQEIGGTVSREFARLSSDIHRFLAGTMSLSEANRMMEHALRIEQDTREL